mmetsp:Transcript_104796/g.291858  ORF Transcript_104796/g.291858 Transcript_104796/m.291858 type:complete len:252 (+) Transcript_104796:481-1236(+)
MRVWVGRVTIHQCEVAPGHGGGFRVVPIEQELVGVLEDGGVRTRTVQTQQFVLPFGFDLDPRREHCHRWVIPHRLQHQLADVDLIGEIYALQTCGSVLAQDVSKHKVDGQRHGAATSLKHGIEEARRHQAQRTICPLIVREPLLNGFFVLLYPLGLLCTDWLTKATPHAARPRNSGGESGRQKLSRLHRSQLHCFRVCDLQIHGHLVEDLQHHLSHNRLAFGGHDDIEPIPRDKVVVNHGKAPELERKFLA